MNKKQPAQTAKEASPEERAKIEAFMADYREVAKKHGIDIQPALSVTDSELKPILRFVYINADN